MKKVYVIGSLRNERIPMVAHNLREVGFEVFDDWYAVGPEADDHWKAYEQGRGRTYKQALQGKVCENSFNFDFKHIVEAAIGVLVMSAGKSAHTELGFMAGMNYCAEKYGTPTFKKTFVLLEEDADRWDIMYKFFTGVAYNFEELLDEIGRQP